MYEDNDACSSVVKSGYSPKLRHLVRTQRTSTGMLSEVLLPHEIGTAEILRTDSANQKADALTKPLIGDKLKRLTVMTMTQQNVYLDLNGLGMQLPVPPSTARGADDPMPIEGPTTPPPPMECDDLESGETKARVRKISLSQQASITEAFQGLHLDRKCMFGQSTPFLTVRNVFTGWIYAHPVGDKSKPEVEKVLRRIIGARSSYKILGR
eukprot:4673302-Amphidinium_carterae.1